MISLTQRFGLPLLAKELIEQASRRRTYLFRAVYASLFFLACLMVILPELSSVGRSAVGALGLGRMMFFTIVGWQFAGIYLFLPAMTCSVLTVEKERNTLGLLFLTRLGPWAIIIEKLGSRLLPMYALILCSLPLLAFSVSFGGVNATSLLIAIWLLAVTAFQIGSIAVACSAFFRTTTGALLGCYFAMFLMGFGPAIVDWFFLDGWCEEWLAEFLPASIISQSESLLLMFVGFLHFVLLSDDNVGLMGYQVQLLYCAVLSLPLIWSGFMALLVARLCLVRRAFVPSRNLGLLFLRMIDRLFHAANNNRLTRGVIVIRDSSTEPEFSPIVWRETQKRSLGQTRYLIRILLALELPVLLMIMTIVWRSARDYSDNGELITVTTLLVWLVTTLLLMVTSAGLIAGERGRQTLDILLTLPLTGQQIIRDKIAGVRRLAIICAVPLLTCILFEGWWRDVMGERTYNRQMGFIWWEYTVTAISLVACYIPLIIWFSLWIGLKTKSPTRATLTSLAISVAWCVVPFIVVLAAWEFLLNGSFGGPNIESAGMLWLLQFSPLFLLMQIEFDTPRSISSVPLVPMLINLLIYGCVLMAIRHRVFKSADQLLGRTLPGNTVTKQQNSALDQAVCELPESLVT